MKIVHIIPSFNVGGGELQAVRICAEIKRVEPEHDLYILSLYNAVPTIVYDEALASGAKIITMGKSVGLDLLVFLRIYRALKNIKPDVIHTHLAGLRYAMPASVFFKNAVKIHTVHNMAMYEVSRCVQKLHGFSFAYLGWHPVALSSQVEESIKQIYGIDADVVANGVGIHVRPKNLNNECLEIGNANKSTKKKIITIGRLWQQKNHSMLIDAFCALSSRCNNLCLNIVGEDPTGGSYRRFLEKKVSSLPEFVRENINFLGMRKDVQELLIDSDLFVLSSDWEGVPLTLLEAMGCGVPVVCTSVGGIPDIIESGVDGLLVPKGDAESLSFAMERILSDEGLARTFADSALLKFKNNYSINTSANNYLKLYKKAQKYVQCI